MAMLYEFIAVLYDFMAVLHDFLWQSYVILWQFYMFFLQISMIFNGDNEDQPMVEWGTLYLMFRPTHSRGKCYDASDSIIYLL